MQHEIRTRFIRKAGDMMIQNKSISAAGQSGGGDAEKLPKTVGKPSAKAINEEKKRLLSLLASVPEEVRERVDKLVDRVAFLAIVLGTLEREIRAKGCAEVYKNGENQYGQKESVAAGLHVKYMRSYTAAMKLLLDTVGPYLSEGVQDEFSAF